MDAVDKPPIALALETRLAAAAGLVALVGAGIYWKRAPHGAALPCLAFRQQGGDPVRAMGGDTGLQRTRWLFIGIGVLPEHAAAVMKEVKASLNRLHDTTVAGVFIDSIFLQDSLDIDLGEDSQDEAAGQVYEINYRE
jgi:hypothetical protein